MNEVTKPKNPGRVAAGKRTAELNRKRKEDLLRNQKTVPRVPRRYIEVSSCRVELSVEEELSRYYSLA